MKLVVSIQSHVVHGYVGGKAAVFPLQTQGWEVDTVNTVNFSNHTGYGSYKGSKITSSELLSLLNGLDSIQVEYNAVLSGYIPNAELIKNVADYVKKAKSHRELVYLLDPVLGDQGILYVDESCVAQYRQTLQQKLVDIITPNQFELELLVGFKITTNAELYRAVRMLHDEYHIKYVVISSLEDSDSHIRCAVSAHDDQQINQFRIPVIKSYFTGVGDLFSALLLDKFYDYIHAGNTTLETLTAATNTALTITHKTLQLTHELGLSSYKAAHGSAILPVSTINDGDTMKHFELKIIQVRDYFAIDHGSFKATPVQR